MSGNLDSGHDDLIPKNLKGVFSSTYVHGEPEVSDAPRRYWYARQIDENLVNIQMLDENYLPSPYQHLINRSLFLERFTLEPDLGYRLFTQKVLKGDWYRKQGLNVEAKIEYQQVLRIDEENIRANFGLGLAYLGLNQPEKSRHALEKLVGMDESFSTEHKHLFNEFGIALRKKGLFDEALSYYARAKELCADDENLRLNISRAWLEKGDTERSYQELKGCLEINPDFRQGLAFLAYQRKHDIHPHDKELRAWFDRHILRNSELAHLLDEE